MFFPRERPNLKQQLKRKKERVRERSVRRCSTREEEWGVFKSGIDQNAKETGGI
jgi:hypothetical protein